MIRFTRNKFLLPTTTVLLSHSQLLKINRFGLAQKEDKFLKFIDFDAKYLSEIPFIFKPLEPIIKAIREGIIDLNGFLNLPWWMVLILSSVFIRITIFPLIFIQMKKMSKLGPIWPIFALIKETWAKSSLPVRQRVVTALKLYSTIAKNQNFKMRTIFVYNMAYYPILITMIFSLRSILSVPQIANSGFIYLTNLAQMDPYYILPTLTVAAYYWNFQRFITPQNRNTIISKIRAGCQILLIIWYPFLCCWPSGIVIYMLCNAVMSILQANAMKSFWFRNKINPKITHYSLMISKAEYDKGTSASLVEAIKTGEQSWKEKSISEKVLFKQSLQMIQKLNKQKKQKEDPQDDDRVIQEKNQKKVQANKNVLKEINQDSSKLLSNRGSKKSHGKNK